jgi:hypothetical protein
MSLEALQLPLLISLRRSGMRFAIYPHGEILGTNSRLNKV